jgi:CCR4-NOT transcription complex subunit 4
LNRYKAEDSKRKRIANEKRKHEAQKREIEALNRKHLSGLRVIQRNLVYVTGLNPRIREEELLATLRGDQYFGQYGKILKIVVNKRTAQGGPSTLHNNNNNSNNNNNNNNNHHDYNSQGLGVYVTFSNKNEAEKCIAAVDGSQNGDRTLRYVLII